MSVAVIPCSTSFLHSCCLPRVWESYTRSHVRALRPISISFVPVSEGIEIRQGCRFISSLALGKLPGGLGRFWSCPVGRHMSRSRHLGRAVFSWFNFQAFRDWSSSMPQGSLWGLRVSSGCSCGASGWDTEAPLLHDIFFHTFSPTVSSQTWWW